MVDGAEIGSLGLVQASTGSPSAQGSVKRTGGFAYLLNAAATPEVIALPVAWVNASNTDAISTDNFLLAIFAVRLVDVDPGVEQLLADIQPVKSSAWSINLETDGDIRLDDDSGTLLTVSTPLTANTWHVFEFMWETVTSGGEWELRIDRDVKGSGSAGVFATNASPVRFHGQDSDGATSGATYIDDYGVKVHTSNAISFPSDDAGDPFFEVYGFQGGVGATTAGSTTSGDETDVDELPTDDATTEYEIDTALSFTIDTDAGGSAENGPSGNGNIDDVHGPMALYWGRLKRTNGSSPDSLDMGYGNSGDGITWVDEAANLGVDYDDFFLFTADGAIAPLAAEFAQYGTRLTGAGGRDIDASTFLAQVANAPASVQTISPAPVALTSTAVTPSVDPDSVSVTAAPVALTLSPVTPVMAFGAQEITPAAVAMALAVPTPSVDPISVALTAAPVGMTINAVTPGVAAAGSVSLAAAAVTLTLTPVDPAVDPISVSITAAPVAMALTVVDPAVDPAGSAPITSAPVVLTLSVVTPGVAADSQVSLTPAALAIVLSVVTPGVAFGAATLSPAAVALTLTPVDPALSPISVAMTAAPVALTLAVVDPTVAPSGAVALTAAAVALTLAVVTPGMAAAGSVSLTAAPVVLTLMVVDPGLTSGALFLIPVPVALALTAISPTLAASGSVSLSSAPVGLTLTVVDPILAAAGSVAISAAALALALTVVDPALAAAGSVLLSPAALGMSLVVVDPALTVAGAVALSPAALALALAVVDPLLTGAGSVSLTPSALALLLTVPTPNVVTVAFLLPAPVGLAIAVPAQQLIPGAEPIFYTPFMKWPPTAICLTPAEIMRGANPRLVRREDGAYIRVE